MSGPAIYGACHWDEWETPYPGDELASLAEYLQGCSPDMPLVLTSGGFAPLHRGHMLLFYESARLAGPDGLLVVVLNGDGFLRRKHGYVFMPLADRLAVLAGMCMIDIIYVHDDGSQHVDGVIRALKPTIFAKGGDRSSPDAIAESERLACAEVGCEIRYGVGGFEKLQSSSSLVKNALIAKK